MAYRKKIYESLRLLAMCAMAAAAGIAFPFCARAEAGWQQEDGNWYYMLEDGTKNREELIWDNALYQFDLDGELKMAQWVPNTGGGAYPVFCYDEEEQALFDQMNDEKRDLFFEEYPDREEEYDGDDHAMYDRYAGFVMDERLNQIAQHRLQAAMSQGYSADGTIPGEGSLKDYLAAVTYRKNATCQEVYLRGRDDADDAFSKLMEKTQERYEETGRRQNSLEYYRRAGLAHGQSGQEEYFLVIFMR